MAEDFMAMYKQALQRLSTGGMSLEASLQEIEEGKKQAIAGGQQALVSGGLGGTTVMGGVPLQAEKIAGRQRLGARGRAEEKYLTTLASFAAFAQRGEEAQKQRKFEAGQATLGRQFTAGQTTTAYQRQAYQARLGREYGAEQATTAYERQQQQQQYGAEQAGIQREWETEQAQLKYSQQFPAIYGQEGAVPDWTGGGTAETPWPTAAPLFKEQEELGIGQSTAAPTPQQVGMTGGMGTLPGMKTPAQAESYSPGDPTVGALLKDGVLTRYYRTKSGKVVPGPAQQR